MQQFADEYYASMVFYFISVIFVNVRKMVVLVFRQLSPAIDLSRLDG